MIQQHGTTVQDKHGLTRQWGGSNAHCVRFITGCWFPPFVLSLIFRVGQYRRYARVDGVCTVVLAKGNYHPFGHVQYACARFHHKPTLITSLSASFLITGIL
jgi:hypothetical protein